MLIGAALLAGLRYLQGSLNPWLAAHAAVGFSLFWLLHLLFRGRLGLGDAQLSAFLAFALGLWGWVFCLGVASLTGITFVLVQVKRARMTVKQSIPFAPFLAVGAVSVFVYAALVEGSPPGRIFLLGDVF